MEKLSFSDMKSVNKWWQRGFDKERARLTHSPKPFKGDKTSVPENFSNFAPPLKPFRKTQKAHAR